jgi:hypothetical protein
VIRPQIQLVRDNNTAKSAKLESTNLKLVKKDVSVVMLATNAPTQVWKSQSITVMLVITADKETLTEHLLLTPMEASALKATIATQELLTLLSVNLDTLVLKILEMSQ